MVRAARNNNHAGSAEQEQPLKSKPAIRGSDEREESKKNKTTRLSYASY